jgi:hypothetical protein
MNNVIRALKLDFYIVKSSYSRRIIIYFVSVLLGFLAQPLIPVFVIMFFCVSFSGLAFSITEKNNCEKLYGILPIQKSEVIIGRYLYAIIFGLFNLIISLIIAYIISILTRQQLDSFILFLSISLTFCYYCFAVGISYPIYLKFGFSKSYIFISLPLYLLILLVVFLSEMTGFYEIIGQALQYFSNHNFLFLVYVFIFSIVILIISAFISYRVFKNLEL